MVRLKQEIKKVFKKNYEGIIYQEHDDLIIYKCVTNSEDECQSLIDVFLKEAGVEIHD